jgi:hypothetical protein
MYQFAEATRRHFRVEIQRGSWIAVDEAAQQGYQRSRVRDEQIRPIRVLLQKPTYTSGRGMTENG